MSAPAVATKRVFADTDGLEQMENVSVTGSKKQKVTIVTPPRSKEKQVSVVDEDTGLSRCFHRIRAKMYLSLAPCYLETPIEGLRQQHLDPLIMSYNPTVEGVIITYNNVRLAKENINNDTEDGSTEFKFVAKVSDENPFSFVWAVVDFVVWRPRVGDVLEGYSIMQSQSHIGLLINDVFSASIKKFYIPEDWYFVPNQADETSTDENNFKRLGHWCDSNEVPVGGKIKFTVRGIHVNDKGLSIEGTLLTPDMERDSQPVMLDSIKDNIKKHVKFDGETTEADADAGDNVQTAAVGYDDNINEEEMKEKLPVIESIKEDPTPVPGLNESSNGDSDAAGAGKDDAPKYNDDSSDSDSSSDSDDDGSGSSSGSGSGSGSSSSGDESSD